MMFVWKNRLPPKKGWYLFHQKGNDLHLLEEGHTKDEIAVALAVRVVNAEKQRKK